MLWSGIFSSENSSMLALRSAGLGGKLDKYLPSKCSNGNDYYVSCTFSYVLNDQGAPKTIEYTILDKKETSDYTVTLTYKK